MERSYKLADSIDKSPDQMTGALLKALPPQKRLFITKEWY